MITWNAELWDGAALPLLQRPSSSYAWTDLTDDIVWVDITDDERTMRMVGSDFYCISNLVGGIRCGAWDDPGSSYYDAAHIGDEYDFVFGTQVVHRVLTVPPPGVIIKAGVLLPDDIARTLDLIV